MDFLPGLILLTLVAVAYQAGTRRSLRLAGDAPSSLHSRPVYHGYYVALWCGVPALAVWLAGLWLGPRLIESMVLAELPSAILDLAPERLDAFLADVVAFAQGEPVMRATTPEVEQAAAQWAHWQRLGGVALLALVAAVATAGLVWARGQISVRLRARNAVERVVRSVLAVSSGIAILVTVGIVSSLVFEAARFFAQVPVTDFLFGLEWSPQTAIRSDQVGSSGSFGAVPLFAGTLLITVIAMLVAAPVGLFAAIYLAEYASSAVRAWVKPTLEILAGIPTVVYGFFAAITVAPFIGRLGDWAGVEVASGNALAAGLVMGVMIIPFVSSLSDDIIRAVPNSLREGSLGLGATPSETIRRVVLPAALPGIVGALLLAVSRAIGETMIVYMAAGLRGNLTWNPLEEATTVTVQIVALLTGDQEFDSAKTLSAFALGLLLFVVTLALNLVAQIVVRRYREQYD